MREEKLERIIRDTFWMARRYANQRHTYAPTVINDALKQLTLLGIGVHPDNTLLEDGNSNPETLDI